MQTRRVISIPATASICLALVLCIAGAPEASSPLRTGPGVFYATDPGLEEPAGAPQGREPESSLVAQHARRGRDADGDGVPNREDACPDTPEGAGVDLEGCPTDEDRDGVFDGLDQCAGTARGATVDAAGCPRDSDADGVLDGLDRCADTDPRTLINEDGCPYDTDGDGVLEGIDQCEATPMGALVDERGCAIDTDEDGVPDGLDECPETSMKADADASGCSRLQRGEIELPTIRFRIGVTRLAPGSSPDLDELATLLKENPDLVVEIGGHTDNEGPARLNRKISLERAEAVKAYLVSRGVPASRMAAKGYGEVHPIATNRYAEGRARNRRIEFKVLPPSADKAGPEAEMGNGGPGGPPLFPLP